MGYPLRTKQQAGWGTPPWSRAEQIRMLVWRAVWLVLFRPTPKLLNAWRLALLRMFGAELHGRPFVSNSSFVRRPWDFAMHDQAALGENAEVYNLGHARLRERSTVAQEAYLCGGTHDMEHPDLPLVVADIEIGAMAFIGARAMILPGVIVGEGAVVGAGSLAPKDVPAWTIGAGNPWRAIRARKKTGGSQPAAAQTAERVGVEQAS